jgi:hypothetical protein
MRLREVIAIAHPPHHLLRPHHRQNVLRPIIHREEGQINDRQTERNQIGMMEVEEEKEDPMDIWEMVADIVGRRWMSQHRGL